MRMRFLATAITCILAMSACAENNQSDLSHADDNVRE